MTDEQLTDLIAAGERPGVEFKNARALPDSSFVEVVRVVLGMANRRDGGIIVIGVNDDRTATGLTKEQAASWAPADRVRQSAAPYADPYVYFDVDVHQLAAGPHAGHTFTVIKVQQFEDIPVLCARQGKDAKGNVVLRPGACYVRSNHMPATTEVADHAQMRDLLDLAIEIGVRKFLRRAEAVGLAGVLPPTDADEFKKQEDAFGE